MVQKLAAAASEIIKGPDVQKRLADQGDQSMDLSPAQLADFLREERGRWGNLITTLGLKVQ